MPEFRVGVDIGGTFTDIVFLGSDGRVLARKVASTPDDYSRAVLDGIADGLEDLGVAPGSVSEVSHGFTVATNAIIEQKGAHTALITTEGFRDILEFRRNRTPRLYDLYYEKSPTLIKRQYRLEVGERLNFRGEVLRPLDVDDVDRAVQSVLDSGVESVAVCLLHSYANPDHEQYIAQVLRQRAPDVILTLSSDLLPEMKEYERTSTTVINSYVRPVVERYLTLLTGGLTDMGVTVPLTVMQSNGGLATSDIAKERPVYCIESGPAAGVVGAYHLGRRLGMSNLMTLDMGGTTAKASIIENGEMLQAPEYEVGGEISVGHRLLRGSGHILRVPAIDLAEVGAGGGSIATVDRSGSLRVGPQSSGAFPGPACYRLGGPGRHSNRRRRPLGLPEPATPAGGRFRDRRRAGPSGSSRPRGPAIGPVGSGGGPRNPHLGQFEHGPRPPGRVQRARTRPPAFRPGLLRRRRPGPCRRPGRNARHLAGGGAALSGSVQLLRAAGGRRRAPLRPDLLQDLR